MRSTRRPASREGVGWISLLPFTRREVCIEHPPGRDLESGGRGRMRSTRRPASREGRREVCIEHPPGRDLESGGSRKKCRRTSTLCSEPAFWDVSLQRWCCVRRSRPGHSSTARQITSTCQRKKLAPLRSLWQTCSSRRDRFERRWRDSSGALGTSLRRSSLLATRVQAPAALRSLPGFY